MNFRDYLNLVEDIETDGEPQVGDFVDLELGDTLIETYIVELLEDGVVIKLDETAQKLILEAKQDTDDKNIISESQEREAELEIALSKVQNITRQVKYDNTVSDIIAQVQEVADKFNLFKAEGSTDLKYAINDIFEAQRQLESAIYGLDEIFEDQLREERDRTEREEYGDLEEAKYQGREVPLGKPMAGDVKKSKVYVRGPKGNVVKVNFGQKGVKIKKNNPGRRKNFRARHNCDNPGPRWKAKYWSCRAW